MVSIKFWSAEKIAPERTGVFMNDSMLPSVLCTKSSADPKNPESSSQTSILIVDFLGIFID